MPARAPERLAAGEACYELATDVAVVPLGALAAPERALLVAEEQDVAVLPAASGGTPPGARPWPVYRLLPAGGVALPTGRVFVRFGEGDRAEAHRAALAGAGFVIDAVPAWAPHAAWLRAASGDVTEALAGMEALGRLPGAVHVEPELLRARAPRGG